MLPRAETTRPRAPTAPRRTVSHPPTEPTVLVIGADDSFLPALRVALARHNVYVESSLATNAVETVVVTAPDLVLLVGEAARDAGRAVLRALTESPVSAVVPVALLGEDSALSARLQAFRHGAAAVIARSPSVDAIAEQVARLARDIPERGGAAVGLVGEATLAELVSTLHQELRAGILSVNGGEANTPVRLVLGGGKPLAAFIDQFVARVRRHVIHAEPLEYEFDDRAAGTIQLLASENKDSEPPPGSVAGLRILLLDENPARVDVVAQELRAREATVVVSGFTPSAGDLGRLRQIDPQVVIVGEVELHGPAYALLQRLKSDTRLRWASLLVVRWSEIWEDALGVPSIDRIRGALAELGEPDRGLFDRAALGDPFDARLEVLGPARCLRALAECHRPIRVSLDNARLSVEVDVSDGLVVGATAVSKNGERWEGPDALAAFLVLRTGRIHVETIQQPATTSVMAPVDVALNLAEQERAPITPSLPAEAASDGVAPPANGATPLTPPAEIVAAPTPGEPVARRPGAAAPALPPRTRSAPRARFAVLGVSRSVALLLVALAIGQGLLLAFGLSKFFARVPPPSASASAAPGARPLTSPVPTATVITTPAPGATSAAAAPAVSAISSTAVPAVSAISPTAVPAVSGADTAFDVDTSVSTPSCSELLQNEGKLSSYPGAAYDRLKLARRALVRGDMVEAQRGYCAAVLLESNNPSHHFELAQLLLLRRDGKAAVLTVQEGLRLEPESTRAQSLLGDALALVGDGDGARTAWYRAAGLANADPEQRAKDLGQRSMAEAEQAFARKDYARAERFFRRAIILLPATSQAAVGLATALLRQGDSRSAMRWAERAASLAPRDPLAAVALGDAALAAGDRERAKQQFQLAVELGHREAARRLRKLE